MRRDFRHENIERYIFYRVDTHAPCCLNQYELTRWNNIQKPPRIVWFSLRGSTIKASTMTQSSTDSFIITRILVEVKR
jgi:hypothetical protein